MSNIRPYIAINEMIERTAPTLLQTSMPGVIVGPAYDEKNNFEPPLNFTVTNNITLAQMLALDSSGKTFKVAGAREGSKVLVDTIKWGAKQVVAPIDFGDKEYHVHVKSSDEKYILVLESGDNYVTEEDLINMGAEVGDSLTIDPPTDDDQPFTSTIRTFEKDADGNLLIYLWEEVPYDVDESTSLTAHEAKHFEDVRLVDSGFTYEEAVFDGTYVTIKGPGAFNFEYFVYKPTDETPTLDNIKVSLSLITLANYTSSVVNTSPSDGILYNFFIASRTDLSKQIISVNYENYKDIFGEPTKLNKLGTAFDLIAREVPGFSMYAYVTANDTSDAYIEALNILATSSTVYEVSVLTDNITVLNALKGMIDRASDPVISAFKMGIFCGKIPFYSEKMRISQYTITANNDGTYTFVIENGGLSVSDVKEGDYIIGDQDILIAEEEYYNFVGETYSNKIVGQVVSIVTDSKLIVKPIIPDVDMESALSSQGIVFIKRNSNDEIISILNDRTSSLDNMHLIYMVPDKFISDAKIYAGYYLAALLNAVLAHLPPQQGLSNLTFNVVDKIINSAFLFTDEELDRIAEKGALVITQISYDSKPFIIRQTTTNTSSLEEMEINKVRCLDYAALEVKKSLDGYVGKRNVTERNLLDIKASVTATLNTIIRMTQNDLLGPVIVSYTINTLEIPSDNPDSIVGDIDVVTPTSLNAINLSIKSKG